jgi:hypothetical protein
MNDFKTCIAAAALFLAFPSAVADSHWNTLIWHTCGTRLTKDEPLEYGEFYGRIVRLEHSGAANGRLIATYEHFPSPFVIFRSDDDGLTWRQIATTPHGQMPAPWMFEGEPHLFELPQATADLPAGTLLIAGSTVKQNADGKHLEQRLELYASRDQGLTWSYRGTAATCDGLHGNIWEPNIQLAANGHLMMYFSDERLQPTYSQVLAEQESTDGGRTWGPSRTIVAVPDGRQRPGMAVTQKLSDGRYVMSYEWINGEQNPAYVRFSRDGIEWGDPKDRGIPVKASSGAYIGGTPYCLWMPKVGPKGALVVNARELNKSPNTDREVFVNFNLGEGPWIAMPSPVQWQGNQEFDGWSMGMIATADGHGIIQMASSYAGKSLNEILIARSPVLVPGQRYMIVNAESGLALSVPGDSKTHGTLLQQLPPSAALGQEWTFEAVGDETFAIVNSGSGLAMDDFQFKSNNSSPVAVYDKNLLPVQQWKPIPVGDGTYKFLNMYADRVIGITGDPKKAGAQVSFWDDDGDKSHCWKIVPVVRGSSLRTNPRDELTAIR